MKKKLVMKKWVEVVLIVIAFVCLLVCASECENTFTFAVSHILGGIIMLLIGFMFMSYGRESD